MSSTLDQCVTSLKNDGTFRQAVAARDVHATASRAAELISLLASLVAVGDVVCQPAAPDVPGVVQAISNHAEPIQTKLTVQWATGHVSDMPVHTLALVQRGAPATQESMKRKGRGSPRKSAQRLRDDNLSMAARELLQFEEAIPWECVHSDFLPMRPKWRKRLQETNSCRDVCECLLKFLQVLRIQDGAADTALKCTSADVKAQINSCAASEDSWRLLKLWRDVIRPEFQTWTKSSTGLNRTHFMQMSRVAAALEGAARAADPGALEHLPLDYLLPSASLPAAVECFQRELDFLKRKEEELVAAQQDNAPLCESHLQGVTYGLNGLGGIYGRVARPSVFEVQFGDQRMVPEDDAGSEVTDLEDSWVRMQSEAMDSRMLDDEGVSRAQSGVQGDPGNPSVATAARTGD